MKNMIIVILTIFILFNINSIAQENLNETLVKQAVLDYIEALYEVDSSKIIQSVRPDLAKRGFQRNESGYTEHPLTYEELVELAKTFNKDGKIPDDAPKEVTIFEILDQTASAKAEAWWGIDFLHLAKYDGKWMVVNVLWQSNPVKRE
jgi:hypothetical protein